MSTLEMLTFLIVMFLYINFSLLFRRRPCGPMDKASDYGSGDSRFESWQGRFLFIFFFLFFALQYLLSHAYQDTYPSFFKIRKK